MTPSLQVALIISLGIVAQWIAWRLKLPAIVLLLGFGLLLGNATGLSEQVDGEFFFAAVSLAVSLILFEGGLSLNVREISGYGGIVVRLVTVAVFVTWLMTTALAYWVAGFSASMAFLLGALLTVSGPTVVLPLLRHVQPVRRVGSLARWEGIVNDPIGAVLAALVFEVVLQPPSTSVIAASGMELAKAAIIGIGLGTLGAWLVVQMLRRYWAPDYLHSALVLGLVLVLFAASNAMQHESGLITVTVMGIALANQRAASVRHVVEFKENLRVLLMSTLFIVLAARIKVDEAMVHALGWRSIAFALALVLIVRPVAVWLATIGSPLSWREKVFFSWIHPRGIVAAAVSALFGLRIVRELGEAHPLALEAERFVLITFLVIIVTVLIYGLTLSPLARWLGLSSENPQGILFAGASRPVREIAAAVKAEGFPVLLVDTNPRNNAAARMASLPVAYASIGSEFVQEEIDLGGIGRMLAMTPNDEVNTLAVIGLTERFGRAEVYQLKPAEASHEKRDKFPAHKGGRRLFSRALTFAQLEALFDAGAKVKKTVLREDFTYEDYLLRYGNNALILFRVDDAGKLWVASTESQWTPRAGHKLIALVSETGEPAAASEAAKPAAAT
ncbi:MAG TPA: sodium:proton antiporter [Lacipirellula sp.]